MPSSEDTDADDWVPGICWFCRAECNEQSQACGKCSRKLTQR